MKTLLVYPRFPTTYWGFQHSLPLIRREATLPPLGLVTLAALLPKSWPVKLVDLNVRELRDDDLRWADVVLTGGMLVQAPSLHEVVRRARSMGRTTVAGGPAPSAVPDAFGDADIVFVGEAEGRIESLVRALETGGPRKLIPLGPRPDPREAPVPRFDLLDIQAYCSMSVQFSRGCPFHCEFCDVVELFGRVPRVKTTAQILAELNALYRLGYRGSVFVVDDNFIGNRRAVMDLLPPLGRWQEEHGVPFELYTEASVNVARDHELVDAMVRSGFTSIFLGIETPSNAALSQAGKHQNCALDLRAAVDELTRAGLQVMGGFIVGFDTDGPESFEALHSFLRSAPIPLAMTNVLTALPRTELWRRLQREGRLRQVPDGDTFGRPNFVPRLDEELLLRGYGELLADLYSPASYYRRVRAFLERVGPTPMKRASQLSPGDTAAFLRALWKLGVRGDQRGEFRESLAFAARRAPHAFRTAVVLAIQGEHLIRYTREEVLPRVDRAQAAVRRQAGSAAARVRERFVVGEDMARRELPRAGGERMMGAATIVRQ